MKDQLNVIVTCTKDKRAQVEKKRRLRSVPSGKIAARFEAWVDRLKSPRSERVRVQDLYAGDHWSTVSSFASSRFKLNIWVCSAGYGLVHMNDEITPYAATFSSKNPDSVFEKVAKCDLEDAASEWWRLLTTWHGPSSRSPRSLRQLAKSSPRSPMLVIASKTYLQAIAEDLRGAVENLSSPEYLSIVSAGTKSVDGLTQHLVPCDARMQHNVGGPRRSLNTRLGRKMIDEALKPPMLFSLKRKYRKLLGEQPEMVQYNRVPLSDDEVRRFLREELKENSRQKHTPLLRKLRDSDRACEQSRFASLYREVMEELHGSFKEK